MINVVIPMAGAGNRFKIAGFDVPKPFIDINGKMMIEHVLDSFNLVEANFILVIQQKFLDEQFQYLSKIKEKYNVQFADVPKLTMGAAITALAAHKLVNPDFDIIFADSDNIFNPDDISNFVSNVRERNLDGALLTFNSDEECFSYALTDENGYVIETKEKKVISNNAVCGVYYFKKLEDFKNSVIDLIIDADLSNGEFYMSSVYNHLRKITQKIGIYLIKHFDCVGTPEKLESYKRKECREKV